MWWVIGGRRIRGEAFVLGVMLLSSMVALAMGMNPLAVLLVGGFVVLVVGANALSVCTAEQNKHNQMNNLKYTNHN